MNCLSLQQRASPTHETKGILKKTPSGKRSRGGSDRDRDRERGERGERGEGGRAASHKSQSQLNGKAIFMSQGAHSDIVR